VARFVEATVEEILLQRKGLQRVRLDADHGRAYVLTDLIGPVATGDRVVVNTTAVNLDLGTGGWHVVHWNLSRHEWHHDGGGHILSARYTSEQHESRSVEETTTPRELAGRPVVVCELHSQMGLIAQAAKHMRPELRIVYVMTDQAALPIAISDLVAQLRDRNIVDVTVTTGQSFGGDLEAVNVASALAHASGDLYLVAPGPGVVGTNSTLGFGGLDSVAHLHVALELGANTYFALRANQTDERERHRGISHHSTTILRHADRRVRVAVPSNATETIPWTENLQSIDIPPDLDVDTLDITSMGRPIDSLFRDYTLAAAIAATLAV
jgi:hypothetical protein